MILLGPTNPTPTSRNFKHKYRGDCETRGYSHATTIDSYSAGGDIEVKL